MDYTSLVATLDGFTTNAKAMNGPDVKWTRQLANVMASTPDAFDIDWTGVEAALPTTTVEVDVEAADAIAKTLEVLASDDDTATKSVEDWKAARPAKRRSSGARQPKDSDNPTWTLITITDGSGRVVHTHSRQPGAISSLYYPTWEYLRDHNLATKRDWDPVRKSMVKAIHNIDPGTFRVGEHTIEVSF